MDAATKGFKEEVTKELGKSHVKFDTQNAQGDSSTATTICNNFASENEDLILANATASLQAASAATKSIPILGTAVTNYQVALNLKKFNGTVGGNISGTSDLAPLDKQEKR
ncbi:ABC transporter substrate-binding protein [Lactobacillus delbrueckii subsp. bulgaricus]|nr:ABC transporter substrate binding protein [Lactobacillus delbrueckii]